MQPGPDYLYGFGPFELDTRSRRLARAGEQVPLGERAFRVLLHLVSEAGAIVSKDALIDVAWDDVVVTENSLEQVVSGLRRLLGDDQSGRAYLETVPRQGYRFAGEVTRTAARETDQGLDALLAPHRAWIEGRASLETLERTEIASARAAFERALAYDPDHAIPHVGLANAFVLQFEMTRGEVAPDVSALASAVQHAREACRLDPQLGEAWATLGFVLDRAGDHLNALAASRRAVMLEPDNWRHFFRLALVSWGEERLRAARRVLALLPGFALAHWLVATVYVARQTLDEAARELTTGLSAERDRASSERRFSGVALHWLLGLVSLAQGDEARALEEFEREIALEVHGHLYAAECAANCWYAIAIVRRRHGQYADATAALDRALARCPAHPMAQIARRALGEAGDAPVPLPTIVDASASLKVDAFLPLAAGLVLAGRHEEAAALATQGLVDATPGPAGWLLPVEPLFAVSEKPGAWAAALTMLRARAV